VAVFSSPLPVSREPKATSSPSRSRPMAWATIHHFLGDGHVVVVAGPGVFGGRFQASRHQSPEVKPLAAAPKQVGGGLLPWPLVHQPPGNAGIGFQRLARIKVLAKKVLAGVLTGRREACRMTGCRFP